jgi:predicted negative regulator of RcsB-dependent stress response
MTVRRTIVGAAVAAIVITLLVVFAWQQWQAHRNPFIPLTHA